MTAPRYEVIKKYIVSKVEKGLWLPGHAVLSENQLAEKFAVSRMTARRAVTELTEAGVLSRVQGSGTFVAEQLPTGSVLEIRTIDAEIEDRGHTHRSEVLTLNTQAAPKRIAFELGINEGDDVFFSRVLHFEVNTQGDEFPIQLEERFVNCEVAPNYLDQDFSEVTPSAYLSSVSPLSEADHWIEATLASKAQQKWLGISDQTPCLKLSRRTYSSKTNDSKRKIKVVNFATLYHPGNRYRLGGHLVTGG